MGHTADKVPPDILLCTTPFFVSFTCRQQENTSSYQRETLSVLSLEQCGVSSHREQWPHVARMVLGGRSGRSGGGQTVSH